LGVYKITISHLRKENNTILISILVVVKNVENYIYDCINSILNQTYTNFEIIVIEEFDSSDRTEIIIKNFKDKRIRYFKNRKWLGLSKSRNVSVKHAKGRYIFFTDGDCVVSQDWLEQGLKFLKETDCVAVEGQSYNVSEEYKPTFSDHIYRRNRGNFMTNNMAYNRIHVEIVGGFDERYSFHEDRDLALRIQRFGKIGFNPNMKVFVQQQTLAPRDLIKRSHALKNKVFLFKRFGEKNCMIWRIVEPESLIEIIFPPLFFASLLAKKFTKLDDLKLVPFKYVNLVFSRLKLWKESAKERVFLI